VKILKSTLSGAVVAMLSVFSVQAASVYTYNTNVLKDTVYDGGTGTTGTTYKADEKTFVGTNTYMSYKSTDFSGVNTGDNLLASTHMSDSGDPATKSFIADVLGTTDFTWTDGGSLAQNEVTSIASTGLSTLSVGVEYGYFLLKFGGGNDKEINWLFDNSTSTSNFTWLTMIQPINDQGELLGLSHVSFATCNEGADCGGGGPIEEVPIPAAIWLFGSALLGFTAFGSKKKVA